MSIGKQVCSTTQPVLCWLLGHTLRLDSLHFLLWCVYLLLQSDCRISIGRCRELVRRCNFFVYHCRARLMPFTTVSNSARLMCRALFAGHNQHASSNTTLSFSDRTSNANELALTYTFISSSLMHHFPWAGSLYVALSRLSAIIRVSRTSLV